MDSQREISIGTFMKRSDQVYYVLARQWLTIAQLIPICDFSKHGIERSNKSATVVAAFDVKNHFGIYIEIAKDAAVLRKELVVVRYNIIVRALEKI